MLFWPDAPRSAGRSALFDRVRGTTRIYVILGDPIAQVRSPAEFNRLFAARQQDAVLVPLHVEPTAFDGVLQALSAVRNVDGIVLTVPHKFSGLRHCVDASDRARLLTAVNVMRRVEGGGWYGDMVDGQGYVEALREKDCLPEGRDVLLIGAGGAGTAIAAALLEAGVSRLAIFDQDAHRQQRLVMMLRGQFADADIVAGSTDPTGFSLVINATPAGMRPGDRAPLSVGRLAPPMFVGDVITSPEMTPLLAAAQAIGCRILTGNEMYLAVSGLMDEFFRAGPTAAEWRVSA